MADETKIVPGEGEEAAGETDETTDETTDEETGEKTEEETDKEGEEEEEGDKKPEEPEVPVRKTTMEHIIARQKKTIKKLRTKKEGKEETDEEEEGKEGEVEITPEAKDLIKGEIDKRIKPLEEMEISRETENLLTVLYTEEPEAKDYDKLIRKFINYEKDGVKPYEHVPPSVIFHHLAFGEAESEGAEKGKVADTEARLSKTRGRGVKTKSKKTESGLPSIEEMKGMSDEDFNKQIITPTLQI